jgi:hypothetical protein
MPMKNLTSEQSRLTYSAETHCLCQQKFTENNHKCKHHNCLNGEYIDHVCNACNLQLKITGPRRSNKKGGPPARKQYFLIAFLMTTTTTMMTMTTTTAMMMMISMTMTMTTTATMMTVTTTTTTMNEGVDNDEMEFTLPVLTHIMK